MTNSKTIKFLYNYVLTDCHAPSEMDRAHDLAEKH